MDEMIHLLKLVSDKTRLSILCFVREQEMCVCDLVELLGLSQPAISQHLKKLREAGLVQERREGTWMHYRLDDGLPEYVLTILEHAPSVRSVLQEYNLKKPVNHCGVVLREGEENEKSGSQ
jgi:ArsR family transcriptional regulator